MSKNKKSHPSAATLGRLETATFKRATAIQSNFTTPQPRKQGVVESLLLQGEGNALPSNELVRLTGFRSVRELQNEIAREREAGALILSTCRGGGGYFLPSPGEAGQREISAFVATLRARAINTLRALKAAREALESLEGQVSLDDLEGV